MALTSNHLEVNEHNGDVDLIIAAGMAETMGVLLARLKVEWDGQRSHMLAYFDERDRLLKAAGLELRRAEELRVASEKAGLATIVRDGLVKGAAAALKQAEWLRAEAVREAVTARALILMELRSLDTAKAALFTLALRQAPRKACKATPDELGALVGRVLDVWLDRLCVPCEGRGFTGGAGAPRLMCVGKGKCGGSGSRRSIPLSEVAAQHEFGRWLLNVMDSKASEALKAISKKLR